MARVDEFLALLLDRLSPPGTLLTRDPDSNLGRLLLPHAAELTRLEALAEFVVEDVVPTGTTTFLADWERALGLPDCEIVPTSTDERRGLVIEKLTRPANLTASMIENVATLLGFAATVSPGPLDHQFEVALAAITVTRFRAGSSTAGDRLGAFGLAALRCALDHVKPAHTTYIITAP